MTIAIGVKLPGSVLLATDSASRGGNGLPAGDLMRLTGTTYAARARVDDNSLLVLAQQVSGDVEMFYDATSAMDPRDIVSELTKYGSPPKVVASFGGPVIDDDKPVPVRWSPSRPRAIVGQVVVLGPGIAQSRLCDPATVERAVELVKSITEPLAKPPIHILEITPDAVNVLE